MQQGTPFITTLACLPDPYNRLYNRTLSQTASFRRYCNSDFFLVIARPLFFSSSFRSFTKSFTTDSTVSAGAATGAGGEVDC